MLDFFHARRGRAYGFRLKDFSDFTMAEQSIGTGDGSTATFQLIRTLGSFTQPVLAPHTSVSTPT